MTQLFRLLVIARAIIRHRLDTFLPSEGLRWPVRLLMKLANLFPQNNDSRGQRLRETLEELGPVFVKFGQLLSTRRDLLPPDIANELALLQDNVPPFSSAESVAMIEASLGQSVETAFAEFDSTPLASASVAQVHAAKLHSGQEVVVKVIRPGIEKIIAKDVQLLFLMARLLGKFSANGRRMRPTEVVSDYEQTIIDELDLKREAANCSQLRRNFQDSDAHRELLYIPMVIWELSSQSILVLERIYGIPVSDVATLKSKNVDLKVLAERGVEIFFTQVFEHNFFHADMHPGNIFVDASQPASPSYIGVDCAIMGSLSDFDRYYLARSLLAIFNRDYRLVAQLHIESGWVPEGTNVQAFEGMIRSACEPVFEKPLSEISFGTLVVYLFQSARRFGMEVQPSLVLLQKTLLNIEGLGRELYPELNLWDTARPFLDKWMTQRYSPQQLLSDFTLQAPSIMEALPALPELLFKTLRQKEANSKPNDSHIKRLERALQTQQRINIALVTIAILLALFLS